MTKCPRCCICNNKLKKVNGQWQRYVYEVREGAQHFLGGRKVVTKRKYSARLYGCKSCYNELDEKEV